LWSLPTNPITAILYFGFAYYGYSKLKPRVDFDSSKFHNKLLIFLYSASFLVFINFCLENVWLTTFFIKFTFFNEGWLTQIYFDVPSGWLVNYLRNFVYMIILYMIVHDVLKYVNFNRKTLFGCLGVSLYIILIFFLTPSYDYIDWTSAILHDLSDNSIFLSFLSSVGGKPLLFYAFHSLWIPRKERSRALTLDVGCGASPRGTVNVDRLIPNSDRHIIDVSSIPNLVVADAHYLPFKNKAFEKTFCFHMMEHIQNNIQVHNEFKRITLRNIEVRVPWYVWEKVMNKVLFWTGNEAFRKEHHVRKYMKNDFQRSLRSLYRNASVHVRYGFLSFVHGLKMEIKRETIFPFPLPFELIANISLSES